MYISNRSRLKRRLYTLFFSRSIVRSFLSENKKYLRGKVLTSDCDDKQTQYLFNDGLFMSHKKKKEKSYHFEELVMIIL